MNTVTIPKTEYKKLKQHASACLRIAKYITKTEEDFPYDYEYIKELSKEAERAHKAGESVEAGSISEAFKKFQKK